MLDICVPVIRKATTIAESLIVSVILEIQLPLSLQELT